MVDGRSLGVPNVSSSFNFKSGDISGTAAKTSDDKMGQGTEYFMTYPEEDEMRSGERYVDRSAQLSATLNSLAMMNVANIMKKAKRAKFLDDKIKEDEDMLNELEEKCYLEEDDEQSEHGDDEKSEAEEEKYAQSPED